MSSMDGVGGNGGPLYDLVGGDGGEGPLYDLVGGDGGEGPLYDLVGGDGGEGPIYARVIRGGNGGGYLPQDGNGDYSLVSGPYDLLGPEGGAENMEGWSPFDPRSGDTYYDFCGDWPGTEDDNSSGVYENVEYHAAVGVGSNSQKSISDKEALDAGLLLAQRIAVVLFVVSLIILIIMILIRFLLDKK